MSSEHFEHLAEQISSHPYYRVLRQLKLDPALAAVTSSATLARWVVVDTEASNLDPDNGKVIEIGLISYNYDPSAGQVVRIGHSLCST